MSDRNIPLRKILPRLFPPRNIPPMKSMHGNNVVWLSAKYAVDVSEASYKPEQRRGEHSSGEYTGVERSGGE